MKNIITILCFAFFLSGIIGCSKSDDASPKRAEESPGLFSTADSDGLGETTDPNGENTGNSAVAGQITAGEWNDQSNWDFWLNIIDQDEYKTSLESWGIFPKHRFSVVLSTTHDEILVDAKVTLQAGAEEVWQSRTDNRGRAELWNGFFGNAVNSNNWSVLIEVHGQTFTRDVVDYNEGENIIQLSTLENLVPTVDIAMVVDATSSMSDELEYIKAELEDVLERVQNGPDNLTFRLGSVFYRDVGDDYVTRTSDFSTDISKTMEFIEEQKAQGGGDFPEAVHSALEKSMDDLTWSEDARTRLLFLILDAPPHQESAQVVSSIQEQVKIAAEKGIKIIPITASGIDKSTEFLMRSMALASNGTYTFITDHSGIGNDHLEATVGEYEVEYLNDLMVRLIQFYAEAN